MGASIIVSFKHIFSFGISLLTMIVNRGGEIFAQHPCHFMSGFSTNCQKVEASCTILFYFCNITCRCSWQKYWTVKLHLRFWSLMWLVGNPQLITLVQYFPLFTHWWTNWEINYSSQIFACMNSVFRPQNYFTLLWCHIWIVKLLKFCLNLRMDITNNGKQKLNLIQNLNLNKY